MFHKRGRFNNRKGRWQGKEEKRGNENALANCKKPGHLIVDCPNMKSKASTSKKLYKKATKATWDSESESDADDDTANVYFMTNANTINVCSEPSLDVSYLSIYELGDAFEQLSQNYDLLKMKYLKIKKENKALQKNLNIVLKKKWDLVSSLEKLKKDFDAFKVSCKAKFSSIDENEIFLMKNKIFWAMF